MFCCTLLYVHFSIAIILMGKRELIALLNLSSWCLVMVERLFLTVPRGCLQFVIVVFPDHTHLLFFMLATSWTTCHTQLKYVNSCSVIHLYQFYCMTGSTGSCRLGMSLDGALMFPTFIQCIYRLELADQHSRHLGGPIQNMTLDGRVICKLFNSRVGCHYKECKFVH